MRDEGTCSTASGSSLPDYDRVGQLGEPPQYQNTESAAKHRFVAFQGSGRWGNIRLRMEMELVLLLRDKKYYKKIDTHNLSPNPIIQLSRKLVPHLRTRQDRHLPVFTDEGLPPTYESLYGAIKEEWFTSENFTEFLQKAGSWTPPGL